MTDNPARKETVMTKVHVEDWLLFSPKDEGEKYAQWIIYHFMMPAMLRTRFASFIKDYNLFCTYRGKRWRVTNASGMGDICLASDFVMRRGYDCRVCVTECSEWGPNPERGKA